MCRVAGLCRLAILGCGLAWAGGLVPCAAAAVIDRDAVLRLHMLLNLVGEEYRESVHGEERLRAREYAEARAFFEETRQRWEAMRVDHGGDPEAARLFATLAGLLAGHGSPTAVRAAVEAVQGRVAERTGVAPDVFPSERPSTARGRRVFAQSCARCHGTAGDGRGADATGLEPHPSNFTDRGFMAEQTPFDFFHVVSAGRLSAGMPGWGDALSLQERWDAVAYLWMVRGGEGQGRRVYERDCAGCHGAAGSAGGTDLGDPATLARYSDGDLERLIQDGIPGSAMPGLRDRLAADELHLVVSYLRALATEEGAPADAGVAIGRARTLLQRTVTLAAGGRPAAVDAALDAYLAYEAVEKRVALVDRGLSRRLEREFVAVQAAVRRGATTEEVGIAVVAVARDLDAAEATLRSRPGAAAAFVQALTIILREGFEALLIIAALAAYVVRTGHPELRWRVYAGATAGVAASLVTAWAFVRVLPVDAGSQEIFEGVTMLVATAVLFSVSYWLISRAEAVRWQRYIRGRVEAALAGGGMFALAATAFLAVYREGVETVLFYQALLGTAAGQQGYVIGGMAAGACGLALLYLLTTTLGLRVPMGVFFLGTGLVLYAMAFIFAGNGVRELQEAGVVPLTPWPAWPAIGWLGMSPSLEVAALQAALLLAALAAGLIALRRRAPLAGADRAAGSEAASGG